MTQRTFEIGVRHNELYIRCLRCGAVSFNPQDVIAHYCARCHDWHEGTLCDPAIAEPTKVQT